MKTLNQWLAEYSASHRNPINQKIHTVCVPAIFFSIVGALSLLRLSWWLNGALALSLPALVFYARLGWKPFALMLGTIVFFGAMIVAFERFASFPLLYFYATIFVLAWIGQFIGHAVEGKKPSFFEDLQFLLIGPLWVFYH